MCAGNFNDISSEREKSGGRTKKQRNIDEFNLMIYDLNLVDLGFNGQLYTWCNNGRGPDRVCERLYKALSNTQWKTTFPKTQVTIEPAIGLSHSPWIIMTKPKDHRGRKRF